MEQEQTLKTINIQLSQGQIKWLDDNKGSESRSCLLRLIVSERLNKYQILKLIKLVPISNDINDLKENLKWEASSKK